MIDHLDKQTKTLNLEPKRGRGRPATGQALSNAERQRAYRERQKAQRNGETGDEGELYKILDECIAYRDYWIDRALKAEKRVSELEAQLAQRNDNELMKRVELAEAERDAMGNELAKAKAKLSKAGPRKHRDDAPLKTILEHHNRMEERRKSGELSDMDALWRFVGATLQVIEQHGLTAPK